jgi:formate hydrogenlyase subunit 6/NADH:ubiquinone oxidoreductase subunit I
MYLPKIRELKEALTSLFTRPYTTRFPLENFTPADEYRGKPRYNEEYCIGCGTCVQVCPATAIEMADDIPGLKRIFRINYGSCINCGQCEENCITGKGIKLTNEYSFAALDKNESSLIEEISRDIVICEMCGKVIAASKHLEWIKDRIGIKAFAHPNFLIEMQKEFTEVDPVSAKSRVRREDQMMEVCPGCRHKIITEDEFYLSN